jgi:hypothetical protein
VWLRGSFVGGRRRAVGIRGREGRLGGTGALAELHVHHEEGGAVIADHC